MNLPRIYDKDGKPKWDLTGCYDPLLAKPVKKTTPVTPKPEPKPVVVQPSLLSQGTKSRSRVPPGSSSNPAPIAGVAPAAGGVDTSLLPPMGVFLPNGTQATSATPAPMSQSQIQVLANAIQQAAQNGQATPEQASQMMANLMQMVSINK